MNKSLGGNEATLQMNAKIISLSKCSKEGNITSGWNDDGYFMEVMKFNMVLK